MNLGPWKGTELGKFEYIPNRACVSLDYHIQPSPDAEDVPPRADSVAVCEQCAQELRSFQPGDREGHACTHRVEQEGEDTGSIAESWAKGSRARDINTRRGRGQQPKRELFESI